MSRTCLFWVEPLPVNWKNVYQSPNIIILPHPRESQNHNSQGQVEDWSPQLSNTLTLDLASATGSWRPEILLFWKGIKRAIRFRARESWSPVILAAVVWSRTIGSLNCGEWWREQSWFRYQRIAFLPCFCFHRFPWIDVYLFGVFPYDYPQRL